MPDVDSQSPYVSSRWAWVLQDALGIAFCLYMLKTVRLPTFKVAQHSEKLLRCEKCFFLSGLQLCVSCTLMHFLSPPPPGVHLTTDGPFRLRRFLRIYYTLPDKCTSTPCNSPVLVAVRVTLTITAAFSPQSGESIMVEVAAGPSDSATHEKVSLFTKSAPPPGPQEGCH